MTLTENRWRQTTRTTDLDLGLLMMPTCLHKGAPGTRGWVATGTRYLCLYVTLQTSTGTLYVCVCYVANIHRDALSVSECYVANIHRDTLSVSVCYLANIHRDTLSVSACCKHPQGHFMSVHVTLQTSTGTLYLCLYVTLQTSIGTHYL